MRAEFWTDVLIPPAHFILLPSGRFKVVFQAGAKELLAGRTGATAFLDLRIMLDGNTMVFTQDVDGLMGDWKDCVSLEYSETRFGDWN